MNVAGYLGSDHGAARVACSRARDAGMTQLRAEVIAHIASFRDGWAFRKALAGAVRASTRTVQRAITQAKELGLIGVARAKQGEVPPGARGPLACGWSHRWLIGRDLVGAQLKAAIAKARLDALARKAAREAAMRAGVPRLSPAARARASAADLEQRRQDAKRALAEWEAAERSRAGPE